MFRGLSHGAAVACLTMTLTLTAAGARAQVNTASQTIGAADEGLHGNVKGDLSLKRGNAEVIQVGGSALASYQIGVHTPILFGRAEFGQEEGEEPFAQNAFAHARWTAMWHPNIGSEVFSQVQYNDIVLLKFRVLAGAGVRVGSTVDDWFEWYVGSGWMLEYEHLSVDPNVEPHPEQTLYQRWTNYVSLRVQLMETLSVGNVCYVQPRFKDFGDTRVLDEFELEVKASDAFSLVNTLLLRVDTRPPSTVEKVDLSLTAGFRVAF